MEIRDITPYVTVFGPVAGIIVLGDYVLKSTYKARLWGKLSSVSRVGVQPLSLAFYGFVVLASAGFTLMILTANGIAQVAHGLGAPIDTLKSLGPILVPTLLKILVLDYLFALKSYALLRILWRVPSRISANSNSHVETTILSSLLFLADLVVTAGLTSELFQSGERLQATYITPRLEEALRLPSLQQFFDSVSLVAKSAIQSSFYLLNGTFALYLALLVALGVGRLSPLVDEEGGKNNVCKIIAAIFTLLVLIVAFTREFNA